MATYSAAGSTTGAGSSTLPAMSLYGSATVRPLIREIGIFNAASAVVTVELVRLTTLGTQGASVPTSIEDEPERTATALTVAWNTHTVGPTISGRIGRRATFPAAAGSGIVWTFDKGLAIPAVTNAGIGIVPVGTGQLLVAYFVWDE